MPTLVDLEVDEVSLVDRPATGRKFRIFKRDAQGLIERLLGREASSSPGEGAAEREVSAPDLELVWKRIEETLGRVAETLEAVSRGAETVAHHAETLAQGADAVQKRLESLEGAERQRQSLDPTHLAQLPLWKGVL